MPNRAGSGIAPPSSTPASVARFQGMNVDADGGDPVAAHVGPAEPPEVGDREGERLVGQEVGHRRARCADGTSRNHGASAAE